MMFFSFSDAADKVTREFGGSKRLAAAVNNGKTYITVAEWMPNNEMNRLREFCRFSGAKKYIFVEDPRNMQSARDLDDFKELIRRATGTQEAVDRLLRLVPYLSLVEIVEGFPRIDVVFNRIIAAAGDINKETREFVGDLVSSIHAYTPEFDYTPAEDFTEDDWREILGVDGSAKGIESGFFREVCWSFPIRFNMIPKGWIMSGFTKWPDNPHVLRHNATPAKLIWDAWVRWYREAGCPLCMTVKEFLIHCDDPYNVPTPPGYTYFYSWDSLRETATNIRCNTVEELARQISLKRKGGMEGCPGYKGYLVELVDHFEFPYFDEEKEEITCLVENKMVELYGKLRDELFAAARISEKEVH